jgi:5-methylcytosine-specific restriction endonuclease McrA
MAARRRIRGGGPRARGRPAATVEQWADIRAAVLARARWRCQACGARTRLDVHHILKRAQGGSDFDLERLVALCRPCHAQTDAPYAKGRLVIRPGSGGRPILTAVHAVSKWALDRGGRGP